MFVDPQSVTVDAVANSLPRVAVGDRTATYSNGDDSLTLTISHTASNRGRVRRVARLDFSEISADPFLPSQNLAVSGSAYLVIDEPLNGFTDAELLTKVKALRDWLNDANVTKILAGES